MRIAVVHHSLNIPGGAEKLCLSVVEALKKRGHDVSLVTVEKTDWKVVKKNFGTVMLPNREECLVRSRFSEKLSSIPISSMYFSFFVLLLLAKKSSNGFDLVINTFGDAISSIADITYVHFPLRAALNLSQTPAFSNKSMWKSIAPLYDSVMSLLDRIAPGDLLTNSMFMKEIIRSALHRNSTVVYPPVDVETFASECLLKRKDDCKVAVAASYTPKRHLERVPLIAKHAKFAKFIVMGKADNYSLVTLEKLKRQISRLHVEDRITLLANVSFGEFMKVFSEAKVYLHTMPYDHFGISVVEAMASGCVPVVHRSGGPWTDILDGKQGLYGFSYSTPEEAAGYIDRLVSDEDLRTEIALRASSRARKFDRAVFMKKIAEVVEKIAA